MMRACVKTSVAAVALGALLGVGGCATTVDWGGPLLHYRYHYDSRPIAYETAPTVYRTNPTVYRSEPVVVYDAPAATYRERGVRYVAPPVVYDERTAVTLPDHGQ